MRMPSNRSFLLSMLLVTVSALSGQITKRPLKLIRPLKPIKIQPAQTTSAAKPEIQAVSIEDTGFDLTWLVVVENKGSAATPADMFMMVTRTANPPLNAGSTAVPVIAPGQTASIRATFNPDPRIGDYSFRCEAKGILYQGKAYGLGLPTVSVELAPVQGTSGSQWTVRVQNTWTYTLGELRVQVFRKHPNTSAWESVDEKVLGPLASGVSAQMAGAWDPAVAQYKAVVLMRRIPAEPWVELTAGTGNALP